MQNSVLRWVNVFQLDTPRIKQVSGLDVNVSSPGVRGEVIKQSLAGGNSFINESNHLTLGGPGRKQVWQK